MTEVRRTAGAASRGRSSAGRSTTATRPSASTILHVIRLGRAVLVDTTSNEAGAGPDPEADVRRQLDAQTTATATVVAAMCAFTEAGWLPA